MKTVHLILTLCLMLVLEAMIAETLSTEEESLQQRGWLGRTFKKWGKKAKGFFRKVKSKIKKLRPRPTPTLEPQPQPEEQQEANDQSADSGEASQEGGGQQYLK